MKGRDIVPFAVGVGLLWFAIAATPAPVGYHLLKRIPLGAAEGGGEYFDYITVDSAARRLYLSHGTEVKVLDADSLGVVGNITGLKRDHGIALVPDVGRGFITDGDGAQIIMFDLKTLKTVGAIKGEKDADYILYDPADGKGTIYDNLEDTNEVIALDSRTLKIKSRWPVAPAGQPVAIAMDRQHRRLFVSGRNPKMLVYLDADAGQVIGPSFPIGERVDTNVYEPETGLVFSATRDGAVHIFHEDSPEKLSAVEVVKTEFGAKTMGLDSKTHRVFLDTADFSGAKRTAVPGSFRVLVYGP